MSEFYYNVSTGQVEEGRQSPGTELMGPYPTQEAARKALETAADRNKAWDEEDADWEGEDSPS